MTDSLVGKTLCFEDTSCSAYPNLFLYLSVCSGVQEVVIGYYSLVTSGFYPKEDPVVDLLVDKTFCFGVIVLPISISPRGVVIVICLSLLIIRSARPIISRIRGISSLIMLTILIWSILVQITPIIKVAICLGIIPSNVKVLFRAKTPILSRLG
jgi:hypothetical protein